MWILGTSGTFTTSGALTINSLRFNTTGGNYVINTGGNLTIATGGILETYAVGADTVAINNNNLTSNNGQDLIINQYNSSTGMTIGSNITGSIGLTKSGLGALTLTPNTANTFTGQLTINGGSVTLGNANALNSNGTTFNNVDFAGTSQIQSLGGTAANFNFANGTLILNGFGATVGSLTSSSTSSGTAIVEDLSATSATLGLTFSGTAGFAGTLINGTGGGLLSLTMNGPGTQIFSGANTFTGATTISGGVLNYQNGTAFGTDSAITVTSGGTVQVQGGITGGSLGLSLAGAGAAGATGALENVSGTDSYAGLVSLTGSATISSDAGTLNLTNAGTIAGSGDNLTLASAGNGTLSSIIGTAGGTLTKSGAGTWTLTGANTFTGATTISGGILNYQNATAFGTNSAITVNSGATAQVQGGIAGGSLGLSLAGAGASNATGALESVSGANSYAGLLSLAGSATIASDAGTLSLTNSGTIAGSGDTLTLTGAGNGSISSNIGTGGGGLTKSGTGTWTLSGANTYTGATTISAGTLELTKESSLYNDTTGSWTASNIIVQSGGTLAIEVGASPQFTSSDLATLLGMASSGSGGFESGSILGLDTTPGNFSYSGAIGNGYGGGNLGLTKIGANTLTLSGVNTYTGATSILAGGITISGAGSLNSGNYSNTILDNGFLAIGSSASQTLSGVISGSGSLTLFGSGGLTLSGASANTYTGSTTINEGTLKENFANMGTPTNLINGSSSLIFGGGTLQIVGQSGTATSQTFASTSVGAGSNVISAAPASGSTLPTVNLGTMTDTQGGVIEFIGAAYNSGASSGTTLGGNTQAATANITATTNTLAGGVIVNSTAVDTGANAYATVGLYDWAAISTGSSGTQTGTVVGGSQIAGFYTVTTSMPSGFNANMDLTASQTFASGANTSSGYQTFRFNTNAPITVTTNAALSADVVGGILVTPNVGNNNDTIAGSINFQASRTLAGATGLTLWQNNTGGEFIINAAYDNGSNSSATASYVQAGPGTVLLNAANFYTGQTYLDGGQTVIVSNSGVGTVATAAAVNLNGGTLVANATFALDNSGTNDRPVTLYSNGGGLAATAGNTLTVDGFIETGAGTSPLVIGIPGSTANSGTAGLLPGTGGSTPNAAVYATGTVDLTAGNGYFGGTVIDSGILEINGIFALGGADYGGLTFNGGTLQYATGATGNGSLDLTSIGTAGYSRLRRRHHRYQWQFGHLRRLDWKRRLRCPYRQDHGGGRQPHPQREQYLHRRRNAQFRRPQFRRFECLYRRHCDQLRDAHLERRLLAWQHGHHHWQRRHLHCRPYRQRKHQHRHHWRVTELERLFHAGSPVRRHRYPRHFDVELDGGHRGRHGSYRGRGGQRGQPDL